MPPHQAAWFRNATGAHLLIVHHTGKDETRGARGHTSLRAATDTEIEITGDTGEGIEFSLDDAAEPSAETETPAPEEKKDEDEGDIEFGGLEMDEKK